MDKTFYIGIFGGYLLIIISFMINILIGRLLMGKMGYLEIAREDIAEGGREEEERRKYENRLQRLGFSILKSEKGLLESKRSHSPLMGRFPYPNPYSFLPLNVEIRFKEIKSDVYIESSLKMNKYVYRDTGESEYLNALAGYIMSDDFDQLEPPKMERGNNRYANIMILGILSLSVAVAFYFFLFQSESRYYFILIHSLGWAHIHTSFYSYKLGYGAKLYPGELKKSVFGFLSPLFTLSALLFMGYVMHHRYGEIRIDLFVFYILTGLLTGPVFMKIGDYVRSLLNVPLKQHQKETEKQAPEKPVDIEYRDSHSLKINLPLNKSEDTAGLLGVWLFFWLVGEIMVGGIIYKSIIKGPMPFVLFLVFPMLAGFSIWSFLGFISIYILVWNLSAKEILYLESEVFTIEKRIILYKKIESYNARFIRNFRKDPNPQGLCYRNLTPKYFTFEYEGKTVRFGRGVPDSKALEIEQKIQAFLQQYKIET